MKNNWLANFFDNAGEVFEKFNPSAFRFLAAVLPYLTPLPVAWLTSRSSSEFLGFTPAIAFTFVFSLEGIGLWFTSLFVDSVVSWIRSKNTKTFAIVVMFALVVIAYVALLVNLNVTLEEASGKISPALSRVITLLCFLPLLTGIGNGYYKLILEHKTETEKIQSLEERRNQEVLALEEKHREDDRLERLATEERRSQERLEKYKIRHGNNLESSGKFPKEMESSKKVPDWRKMRSNLSKDDLGKLANLSPDGIRQYASETGFTYKTISNWRSNAREELNQ